MIIDNTSGSSGARPYSLPSHFWLHGWREPADTLVEPLVALNHSNDLRLDGTSALNSCCLAIDVLRLEPGE